MSEPAPDEIARAIASITGGKLPPNPDAPYVKAMFQGALAGTLMRAIREPDTFPVKVRDVLLAQDAQGDYLNHFTAITEAGIRLKVTVELEES